MRATASISGADAPAQAPVAERVKLLLVDDDQGNLLALQAILEPLHQELMLAENGTDALRLCLNHEFAAILLDVRMPIWTGSRQRSSSGPAGSHARRRFCFSPRIEATNNSSVAMTWERSIFCSNRS